jgi:hypothetical protein
MSELIVNGGTQTRIGDLGIDRFLPSFRDSGRAG